LAYLWLAHPRATADPFAVEFFFDRMSFFTANYDYALPPELIASHPAPARDQARMMVLDRQKRSIAHYSFRDIPDLLAPDELLVLNDTKVIPARILFAGK
jgi:S-adenosylmethionine:tRNA ribosyltransferase-isomerase